MNGHVSKLRDGLLIWSQLDIGLSQTLHICQDRPSILAFTIRKSPYDYRYLLSVSSSSNSSKTASRCSFHASGHLTAAAYPDNVLVVEA
jgi:hypothetical protein